MKITKKNGIVTVYDDEKVIGSILRANAEAPGEAITEAGAAAIADEVFSDFENAVCEVAYVAEQIYNDPQEYGPRPVPLPDASKDGELTMQVLYSANTDPDDPAIQKELALIGNVQDTLMAVNANHEIMVSVYVATESGFMVQADYIPAKKYDENGELMPLEA